MVCVFVVWVGSDNVLKILVDIICVIGGFPRIS